MAPCIIEYRERWQKSIFDHIVHDIPKEIRVESFYQVGGLLYCRLDRYNIKTIDIDLIDKIRGVKER